MNGEFRSGTQWNRDFIEPIDVSSVGSGQLHEGFSTTEPSGRFSPATHEPQALKGDGVNATSSSAQFM